MKFSPNVVLKLIKLNLSKDDVRKICKKGSFNQISKDYLEISDGKFIVGINNLKIEVNKIERMPGWCNGSPWL